MQAQNGLRLSMQRQYHHGRLVSLSLGVDIQLYSVAELLGFWKLLKSSQESSGSFDEIAPPFVGRAAISI